MEEIQKTAVLAAIHGEHGSEAWYRCFESQKQLERLYFGGGIKLVMCPACQNWMLQPMFVSPSRDRTSAPDFTPVHRYDGGRCGSCRRGFPSWQYAMALSWDGYQALRAWYQSAAAGMVRFVEGRASPSSARWGGRCVLFEPRGSGSIELEEKSYRGFIGHLPPQDGEQVELPIFDGRLAFETKAQAEEVRRVWENLLRVWEEIKSAVGKEE